MDYNHNDNEPWEWQGEDYYLDKDTHLDISRSIWDGVVQNEEDLSYMFDETTPIKACGDLVYNVSASGNISENVNKEQQQYQESYSQAKRRRMLQFNTNDVDPFLCDEQMPSTFLKSKGREYPMVEATPEICNWDARYSGARSTSSCGDVGQSAEVWLPDCLNEGEMHFNSDDMNISGVSDDQIDISEICNIPHEMETDTRQVCATPAPQIVFKGRKSYMKTPTKLASSVAYPFALIKPCEVDGDVTLKDINQKIHTPPPPPPPPPSKSKEDANASPSYPTSAFSGKPVVVKTKIRTQGGKGSITIMRTKG